MSAEYVVEAGYGKLTAEQARVLGTVVQDRVVVDIGAGDGVLARQLVTLGAKKVYAIEKEPRFYSPSPNVQLLMRYLVDVPLQDIVESHGERPVVFLSWPVTHRIPGLLPWLDPANAHTVVYLGCNDGATACGSREFWEAMRRWAYPERAADRYNHLLVYRHKCGRYREREECVHEELTWDIPEERIYKQARREDEIRERVRKEYP